MVSPAWGSFSLGSTAVCLAGRHQKHGVHTPWMALAALLHVRDCPGEKRAQPVSPILGALPPLTGGMGKFVTGLYGGGLVPLRV